MELLNNLVSNVNELLWSKLLIVMLIVLGLYFTFRTNFVQFRFFKEMEQRERKRTDQFRHSKHFVYLQHHV